MSNNAADTTNFCILCGHETHSLTDPQYPYFYHVCEHCQLIVKDPTCYPSLTQEEYRYQQHNNDESSEGYIEYMDTFIRNHIAPLRGIETILDFGSGPYPMLTNRLVLQGYHVEYFDPFFHDDPSYRNKTYDAIVLVEVLEHMHHPLQELKRLLPLLREGGYLIIRTRFRNMDEMGFCTWWYRRDETHVAFFNTRTFHYLTTIFPLRIAHNNYYDVMVFQKQ